MLEFDVKLGFKPEDATDKELRHMCHQAIDLLGMPVSHDYAAKLLEILIDHLEGRKDQPERTKQALIDVLPVAERGFDPVVQSPVPGERYRWSYYEKGKWLYGI